MFCAALLILLHITTRLDLIDPPGFVKCWPKKKPSAAPLGNEHGAVLAPVLRATAAPEYSPHLVSRFLITSTSLRGATRLHVC